MEMVDNVTFRTLLTKLINVVLAIVAVVLVVVSTAANLVAPFLTTRYYMSRFIEMFDSLHDKFFLCSHSEPNIYIYMYIMHVCNKVHVFSNEWNFCWLQEKIL